VTPTTFWHNFWSTGNNHNHNPDPCWPFEPKINWFQQTVTDYYCAKFEIIAIRAFRFIMLTYTPPHTHIVTKWSQYPRRRTTSSAQMI